LPTKFAVRRPRGRLHLENLLHGFLDLLFVAPAETSNTTVCCVSFTPRPFSVMIAAE